MSFGEALLFDREHSKDVLVGIDLIDTGGNLIGSITFTAKFTPNPLTSKDDVRFNGLALYDAVCTRTDDYQNETKSENKPDVSNDNQIVLRLSGKQYWLVLEYNYDLKYIKGILNDKKLRG